VRERVRARHYSYLTEKAYLHWIRRFIRFHGRRHPRDIGKAELEAFLTSLATEGQVSAATQNQALAALLFLYRVVLELPFPWLDQVVRAKPRVRAPIVLTRGEVWSLLGRLNGEAWLVASLLYGSGMRLLECLQTRIKDVDLEYRAITVRDGKGQKDRVVPLAEVLLAHVVAQGERPRLLFDDHRNAGRSGVSLPHALGLAGRRDGELLC
jgi:integrase